MEQNCCLKIGRNNNNYCSGHLLHVDEGDEAYLMLMSNRSESFTVVFTHFICRNHHNEWLRSKKSRCIHPSCPTADLTKALIQCPKRLNVYFSLPVSSTVFIHHSCYVQLNQTSIPDHLSASSSSLPENEKENVNPNATHINRETEIIAHSHISTQLSNIPPTSPLQIKGKRGRACLLQPLTSPSINYIDSSHSTKYRKLQLADSVIKHLSHNPSATEEMNEENEITFVSDYLEYNKERCYQAVDRTQYRRESFQLSEDQTIILKNQLNLTWNQQRILRNYLKSIDKNILPTEQSVRDHQSINYSYEFEGDTVKINGELISYVRVRYVQTLLLQQIAELS